MFWADCRYRPGVKRTALNFKGEGDKAKKKRRKASSFCCQRAIFAAAQPGPSLLQRLRTMKARRARRAMAMRRPLSRGLGASCAQLRLTALRDVPVLPGARCRTKHIYIYIYISRVDLAISRFVLFEMRDSRLLASLLLGSGRIVTNTTTVHGFETKFKDEPKPWQQQTEIQA